MEFLRPENRPPGELDSLYEQFPWLYAFCRDHLFRDDTEKISAGLWPAGIPLEGASLLEIGCGPGFYARRLAGDLPRLNVTGIDRSARQVRRARTLATANDLTNCGFELGDALALSRPTGSVDGVVVSRLFIILPERAEALLEIHRVLKPGGRCFIAEPRSALRAAVPLHALRLLARLSDFYGGRSTGYREPGKVSVMSSGEFHALAHSQPWGSVQCWQDFWYQYAVCEKART